MKTPGQPEKIKLLLMIDFIYALNGGTENQLVKIINNLPKHKYDIHLISLRKTEWIIKNKENLNCLLKTYNIIKLKNPLTIFKFFLIFRYIKSINPDIVMTFFPLSNIVGIVLARIAGVKAIFSTRRDYGLWLDNKISLLFLRFANRFVTRIISNSHNVGLLTSREEKFDLSKIHVIYNGIAINSSPSHHTESATYISNASIQKNCPIVGIVGGLKPMKRHYTFLKAAKLVLRKIADVKFIIVGDGPCKKQLDELTDELELRDHIHFAGSQDNIKPYLSLFDVGINCSSNEGLSNAIMEYMACGVPCIVSRAGGNEELIEHGVNGYTFELDNDKELADLILDLLDDKEKQAQFISRSKEIVRERLSLDRMIKEYDRYFERLLHDAVESDKK